MEKNIYIWSLVALIIGGVGGFLIGKNSNPTSSPAVNQVAQAPSPTPAESENPQMKKAGEVMETAMKDKDSLKADLKDVSGGAGTGTAFNLRKDGKLLFTATGKLPDPPTGQFYEGWVVNKTTNKFEDAGKLEKQKDGTYEVSREFDEAYEGYDFIVITQELVDDQKPEKHILEGTAQ